MLTPLRDLMAKHGCLLSIAFPARTPDGQRIVLAVAACNGDVPSADEFAAELQFDNRHQMARALMRSGLPPLEHISGWAMVLGWTLRTEGDGTSLCEIASESNRDPAICYRLVKRLTGKVWTEVSALGSPWIVNTIRQHYGFGPMPVLPGPARRRSGDHDRPLVKA